MGHKHNCCCYEYEYVKEKCRPACCNTCNTCNTGCNYGCGNLLGGNLLGCSNNLVLPLVFLALFCNRR